jgi:chorismate synthase
MLTYRTAGESHGPTTLAFVEGLPAGLAIDTTFINAELARRQGGYGRGGRQRIETDVVRLLTGVRAGVTLGSPVVTPILRAVSSG